MLFADSESACTIATTATALLDQGKLLIILKYFAIFVHQGQLYCLYIMVVHCCQIYSILSGCWVVLAGWNVCGQHLELNLSKTVKQWDCTGVVVVRMFLFQWMPVSFSFQSSYMYIQYVLWLCTLHIHFVHIDCAVTMHLKMGVWFINWNKFLHVCCLPSFVHHGCSKKHWLVPFQGARCALRSVA